MNLSEYRPVSNKEMEQYECPCRRWPDLQIAGNLSKPNVIINWKGEWVSWDKDYWPGNPSIGVALLRDITLERMRCKEKVFVNGVHYQCNKPVLHEGRHYASVHIRELGRNIGIHWDKNGTEEYGQDHELNRVGVGDVVLDKDGRRGEVTSVHRRLGQPHTVGYHVEGMPYKAHISDLQGIVEKEK